MSLDVERVGILMQIFRRLLALYEQDPAWFPVEPHPTAMGQLRLSRELIDALLDDVPMWDVVDESESRAAAREHGRLGEEPWAIERSMQHRVREEGLMVMMYLSHALIGGDEPTRFRTTWGETRLTIRLWAASGGVTDGVIAVAASLEETLFPLQAPAGVDAPFPDDGDPEPC